MRKKVVLLGLALTLLVFGFVGLKEINQKPVLVITFDLEYPYASKNLDEGNWVNGIDKLLEISQEEDVKFQFFILGKTAERYPNVVKKLVDSGQRIACHTYSHKNQKRLPYAEKLWEVKKCKEVLEKISGKRILGNRFPYTSWEEESFDALVSAGYTYDSSIWEHQNFNPEIKEFKISNVYDDWTFYIYQNKTNSSELYEQVFRKIKKGEDVLVVHHPWVLAQKEERIKGLKEFIRAVKKRAEIKTLDEIMAKTNH